jgi:hypothetical protein
MKRGTWHYTEPQPNAIVLVFPLRPDYVCQFVIPRDLTTGEARRIKALLESLVIPSAASIGETPP